MTNRNRLGAQMDEAKTAGVFAGGGQRRAPSHYETYASSHYGPGPTGPRGPMNPGPSAPGPTGSPIETSKPFILFINTPGLTPGGEPDGCTYIAHIYNQTPKELRELIHIHFLDKHPYRPPGLEGFPQLYDAVKGVYIPYGTKTILAFLHMVRSMNIPVRMEDLHPSAAKFDKYVEQHTHQGSLGGPFGSVDAVPKGESNPTGIAGGGAYVDRTLSNWHRKIDQDAANPYDPSVAADTGSGGIMLDAAPGMSDRMNQFSAVDSFDQGGGDDPNEVFYGKLGAGLHDFQYEGEIEEVATRGVTKLSQSDIEKMAEARSKQTELLMKKIKAPKGGASSQLRS